MAGTSLGAAAPATSPIPSTGRTLRIVPSSSRTRRNHGVLLLGDQLAAVYSSRRERDGRDVLLELGAGAVLISGAMTTTQARLLARALVAAAEAVSKEVRHG